MRYMRENYETKKYPLELALLGLLVIVVLIARLVVTVRTAVVFSKPVTLQYSGLSVPMPAGRGWQSQKQWKYHDNSFTLSSIFQPTQNSPAVVVQCRYLLAAANASAAHQFRLKASALRGIIEKTDRIKSGTVIIDWAKITQKETPLQTFFAVADLPDNRSFTVEVHHVAGDEGTAQHVFQKLITGLEFQPCELLATGARIVTEIKNTTLPELLSTSDHKSFFMIKNQKNHPIGFTMRIILDTPSNTQLAVQAASFLYAREPLAREQVTLFQSAASLDRFTWKSQSSAVFDKKAVEMNLSKDGILSVKTFSPFAREKNYQLSSAAIPEIFIDLILLQMLASDSKNAVVDLIDADGTIAPALISKIETEDVPYEFSLQTLDNSGIVERITLDSKKQISKVLLKQKDTYTLERTTAEDILMYFPERSEYILQADKMLKQEQL